MIFSVKSLSFVSVLLSFTLHSIYATTCAVEDGAKVDCGYAGINQQQCEDKGCCWVPAGENSVTPWCFYAGASSSGYALSGLSNTQYGLEGTLTLIGEGTSTYGADIKQLKLEVLLESKQYVRVKISDAANARWEVPSSIVKRPSNVFKVDGAEYTFSYTESPFSFEVKRNADAVTIFKFSDALTFKNQYIEFTSLFDAAASTFGLGESARTSHALKTGSTFTMWARDEPAVVKNVNLYGSYPFYLQMLNGKAHGAMLMNSNGLDVKLNSGSLTFKTIGGVIDLYVFVGSTPLDVSAQYTSVVGQPAMMPYWSFGFHNCKYGYKTIEEVESIVENYKNANIPLDTQWMDIDYMQNFLDFTTDSVNFPLNEMTAFVNELHQSGMKFVPIIDPGIMTKSGYDAYETGLKRGIFVKDMTGSPYLGQVWPGPTYFPDFFHPEAQSYWTEQLQAFYSDVPFDGLWIDMNEIANFCNSDGKGQVCANTAPNGCPAPGASQTDCCLVCSTIDYSNSLDFPPYNINNVGGIIGTKTMAMSATHYGNISVYDAHNLYGISEQIATRDSLISIRDKRPFLLSRSGFLSTGVQSAKWTGDNGAYWDDLKASIVGIMDFSLFGIPMVGADICGFIDNTNEELCARWIEVGAFYPFSRDHSAIGTISQELYLWDSVASAARNALGMRYQLLPYIYSTFYDAHTTGSLVSRALWVNFPSDPTAVTIDRQFMFGDAILLTPVVDQGATSVSGYFPAGLWYNFQDRQLSFDTTQKGEWKTIDTPLTSTNVHVLGGNIVPLQESAMTTTAGRQTPFTLLVALNSAGAAAGSLFWDDGEQVELSSSLVVSYNANVSGSSGSVTNSIATSTYKDASTYTIQTIDVLGVASAPSSSATLNGKALSSSQYTYNASKKTLTFTSLDIALDSAFALSWN